MKPAVIAIAAALALSAPAFAQEAPAASAAKVSVETTKISDLIKVEQAKAALEKTLPEIAQYYDQIGDMTLKDLAPMSQGALNDENLKALQAEFDKIQ